MVEQIEELRPELQVPILGQFHGLQQGKVHIPEAGAGQDVAPCISEAPEGWKGESRRVHPTVRAGIRQLRVSYQMRAVARPDSQQ